MYAFSQKQMPPKYFVICPSSTKVWNSLKAGSKKKQEFASRENRFLKLEYYIVCHGLKVTNKQLDDAIRNIWPMGKRKLYNFNFSKDYHAMHIRQMKNPRKKINKLTHQMCGRL